MQTGCPKKKETCSLDPFFTPSLSVTQPSLTLPHSLLHSFSILLIQPPLCRPTLQPLDSPYFKTLSSLLHYTYSFNIILSTIHLYTLFYNQYSSIAAGLPTGHKTTPYMTNPTSFIPPLCTPFLHPFSTPLLYPISTHIYISTYTHLMPHPPLTLPLYISTLPLYTHSLYSLSILLSTHPLYNPFLELIAPMVTSQPLHMTNLPLILRLHSPSLSPLYILFLHSLSTTPSLTSISSHMTSFLSILFFPPHKTTPKLSVT